jgi:hypothetical protein
MSSLSTTESETNPDSGDSTEDVTMIDLVYSFDWGSTPLGPMSDWPSWLKSTVVSTLKPTGYKGKVGRAMF